MRYILCALLITFTSISSSAFAADYEVRKFNQGQWFIYGGDVKTALLVSGTSEPQCYQIADILVLLDNRAQALDAELLQDAARQGLAHYSAYCTAKNQQASKARSVVAFVAGGITPDSFGRVTGNDALVSGRITFTGNPSDGILEISTNKVAAAQNTNSEQSTAIADIQRQSAEDGKLKMVKDQASIDAIRARFAPLFEQSKASAKSAGFFTALTGGDRAKLTGAWSGSAAQCSQNVLLLIDNDGKGRVEWWREFKSYGLLPWRSGTWVLKSGTLTMTFNHRTEFTFINGFEDTAMNETVQLDLKNISSDELRLAAPGPNSPALKLLGADEKLFKRCPGG
tara:strand:- start:255 stop:1274 length:1020 start_codon:yes stop_codon:yes gene_type:complete